MTISIQKKESACSCLAAEDLKSIFKFLGEQEIESLCAYLELRKYPADVSLMTEKQAGDFMGFLVKGRLAVKKETRFPGKYILLAILDPGSVVGEISVMECCRRNANVVALEESEVLILTRARLEALLAAEPALGVKVLKRIIQVLSIRLQKADDRLAKLL
jgi:CRP/FNR family transcriptional regulator, cyclic AMP receptor protein